MIFRAPLKNSGSVFECLYCLHTLASVFGSHIYKPQSSNLSQKLRNPEYLLLCNNLFLLLFDSLFWFNCQTM